MMEGLFAYKVQRSPSGRQGENEGGGTHERGTSMPLGSRLGILLVVFSPAFTGSGPCKRY
jgi:hypothetical protein